MPDVLLGESRVYITDQLCKELGWTYGNVVVERDGGIFRVKLEEPWHVASTRRLCRRGHDRYFRIEIPGVRRGRLNGSRTCKHSVEDGTLVLDVRELLK